MYVRIVGTCGFASGSYYGDQCRDSHRKTDPASRGIVRYDLAPAGRRGPSLGGLVDFPFCDFHCGFLPVCVLVPQFQVMPFEGASVVSEANGRYHRRYYNSWSDCSGSSWEEEEEGESEEGGPLNSKELTTEHQWSLAPNSGVPGCSKRSVWTYKQCRHGQKQMPGPMQE